MLAEGLLADAQREIAELRAGADRARSTQFSLERALSDTLTAVNAGYWEVDLRTGEVQWSDGAYRLMGYVPGEVTPSNDLWRERTHPDDYARMMDPNNVLPENVTDEHRLLMPDGTTRWVRSFMNTVFGEDRAPSRLRGILTDITAERAASRQLARMADVASRTGNGVVITDLQGRIEWVNDAFLGKYGWTLDEVRGRVPSDFLVGEQSDDETLAHFGEARAALQQSTQEVLTYGRDGRQFWMQVENRVAYDEAGVPQGFIAIETDVTERRIAESREHVAQRVAAVLLASGSLEEASTGLLSELVTQRDILVAQIWIVDPARATLVYVAGASADRCGRAGRDFVAVSASLEFQMGEERAVGVGLPGLAWGMRRACRVDDFSQPGSDQRAPRRSAWAAAAGFHSFCATPILGPTGVLGVIEIGGTRLYPGYELLPALLERVAEQIAAFMRHDASRRAFQLVFEQSPDALLLVNADGQVQDFNARATELFEDPRGVGIESIIEGAGELLRVQPGQVTASSRALYNCSATGKHGPFSAEVSLAVTPSSSTQAAILSVRDLTERHRLEAELMGSLREKETLLGEVHHRVKNNLQIVSSLLTIQAQSIEDVTARGALEEMVNRVRSMSFVHEQLYGTEKMSCIDLGDYARTLGTYLRGSVASDARISFAVDRVDLAIDTAVPCGLIINELVTNSLKHGHSADGVCVIAVEVRAHDGGFTLMVSDRGRGFPATPPSASSLGVRLVRSLVRQIRGQLTMTSDEGARVSIWVPLEGTSHSSSPPRRPPAPATD